MHEIVVALLGKKIRKVPKDATVTQNKKQKKEPTSKGFDPQIHIKKELVCDEEKMQSLGEESDIEKVSSITDRDQEESVLRLLRRYYSENRTTELPLHVFENIVLEKPKYHTVGDLGIGQTEMIGEISVPMPPLPLTLTGNKTLDENEHEIENDDRIENEGDNNNDNGDGSYEFELCGKDKCKFHLETDNNAYQETIEKDFGFGMQCVGKNCGRSLLECFKHKTVPGAYLCLNCKDGQCRHMYCCHCFQHTKYAENQTRSRRGRNK